MTKKLKLSDETWTLGEKAFKVHFEGTELEKYQYLFKFKNGYGASIIKGFASRGHESDLWELAVIKFDDEEHFNLVYDTPITSDVLGYLNDEEVDKLIRRISEL